MSNEYALITRAELAERLAQLENEAGVRQGLDEVRARPGGGPLGYDYRRQRIRRAYFGVLDRNLRARMIRVSNELEHRERAEAVLQVLSASEAVARARDTADWRLLVPATVLPVVCVWAGYVVAGVPGEIGGLVVALLVTPYLLVRHRRRTAAAVEHAQRRQAELDRAAHDLSLLPTLFGESEGVDGAEDAAFGSQSAVANHSASAAPRDERPTALEGLRQSAPRVGFSG